MTRTARLVSIGFSLGLLVASCAPQVQLVLRDDHCANQTGDAWCAERYDDGSRPFCARGTCGTTLGRDGCVEERPAEDECYSPCGGGMSLPEDGTCLDGGSTGEPMTTGATDASTSDTGTDATTTGPMPCAGDADCTDAAAPFCEPVSGECVRCDATDEPDAACAAADPSSPVCVDGACVQCTAALPEACTGETPICDEATNTCVPCTEHARCGEAACNFYTGACLPADAVFHVGPGQPYTLINAAVMEIEAGAEGTLVIHEDDYDEAVTVDSGRTVAFLAADGAPPRWDTPGISTAPQLTVFFGTALVDGLTLSGNGTSMSPAIRVDGGQAWIDRSQIISNNGGAIGGQGSADLTVRNCFLGGDINDRAVVDLVDSTASILYSTLGAGFGTASALACDRASTVDVRNSVLVARTDDPEVQCDAASIETSATETDLEGSNTTVGPMDLAWFVDFPTGDFHLALVPAPLVNAGEWRQGDPAIDIDGDLRPDADGTPDVPGADVP